MAGIGKGILGLGFGGALLTAALSYMTGRSQDGSSWNPLTLLDDIGGEDSIFGKLFQSGTGTGLAALAGSFMMPKFLGPLRGMAMSLSGLYMAYGLLKNTMRGDFNDVANQVASVLDVDLEGRLGRNTTQSNAEDVPSGIDLRTISFTPAASTESTAIISDARLATAEKLANGLNRNMADPTELAASSNKFGMRTPEELELAAALDIEDPELNN